MIRRMKYLFAVAFLLFPLFVAPFVRRGGVLTPEGEALTSAESLYVAMQLEDKVTFEAFSEALDGYGKITERKSDILTLIDFSKPSTEKRFFVFDLKNVKLLFESVVAHGRNSGGNFATRFSNRDGSHQSSLGFYLTQETYIGRNGYSLVLEGLERGFNDHARRRAIVIHGAAYADPHTIKANGRLGRSFGCPALPVELNRPIIDTIKGGSVLFIYTRDAEYQLKSPLLNQ